MNKITHGYQINKIATKGLIFTILATLMVTFTSGLLLQLTENKADAATGNVYPNGDSTVQWANSTGASHYTEIDEVTYSAADYVNTQTAGSGGEIEDYNMTSVAGSVNSVSSVQVYFRAWANAGCNSTCDDLQFRIFIDGAFDGTTNTYTLTGSDPGTDSSFTWTGTWAGDDDLRVEVTRVVQGTGTPSARDDDALLARLYATVTYTPVPTQVVFTTAQRTLTAGTCSGAGSVITIQLQDSGGTPTNPTGATTIRVTSNSAGTVTIYSDSSCSTQLTNGDIAFTTAENTKSFYIIDTRKSNPTWTLTAAKQSGPDTLTNGTQSITVNAGAVARLQITLPGQTFTDGTGNSGSPTNRTAGTSFNITSISATDIYNNVNTGYSGAKTLVYSGPGNAPLGTTPTYTTSVSFTSGQSTTTLATTLYRAESTTITATDGGSYGYASSSVTVDPGAINNYVVSATTPNIAGTCVSGSSITARDAWNNNRTSDATVVNMTTTGTGLTFYTAAGCGTSTTQYTMSGGTASVFFRTNKKQSGITITATKVSDTPTGTSGAITINPAAASALLIRLPGQTFTDGTGISGGTNFTGLRTPNSTAGTSFTVDVKAVDAFNNLVDTGPNNYTGAKTISWASSTAGNSPSGQGPSYPGSVSFTNGEANTQTITYYNAATGRTVRADDTGTPVTGTASTAFTVQANAAQNYGVSAGAGQTAGVAFNVTVTARDQWNNSLGALYSAPAGVYTWTSTATNAPDTTAPSIGTLAQGDFASGVATKSVTLYKAEGGVTFTATEPSAGATGTSGAVTVSAGNVSAATGDSTITGNSTETIGNPLVVTITLRDTWRNPKAGVAAGNIVVSGTGGPTVNQPSAATDANGQTTADLTWAGTGAKTVSVQINTITLVQNDGSTVDADGFLDDTLAVTINLPAADARVRGGTTIRGGTTF